MLKYSKLKLSYVVQIYNEQEKSEAFNTLIETYNSYDASLLKHIEFIFVDDCSPKPITVSEKNNLNFTLAKVKTDIKWNQGGARNLGVHLSKSPRLIVTDLDHIFPETTLKFLTEQDVPKHIFLFNRFRNNQKTIAHFNTFFLSKSTYFKSLGVDEEFCGHYGHEDVFFLDMQKRLGTKIFTFKEHPIVHFEHKESKKPQHHLIRNEKVTEGLYDAKRRILFDKNKDPFEAHSRLFLNFQWEIIKTQYIL